MAKYQLYKYKEADVSLDFQFEDNESAAVKKEIFVRLLRKAADDLEKENK